MKDGKVLANLGFNSKGIVRAFNWRKCLCGFLHLKPTAGRQISTLILEMFFCEREGRSLLISHDKYIKNGKVLTHSGFKSKVLPGPLTDLSALVGFWTSSPQQGVKYHLSYLRFRFVEGGLYKYPMKNILRTAKFLPTWNLSQIYCSGF